MSNPNANPPEHTKWKPGVSANPGGKTSAQRKLEVENAEKATRIRSALLDRLVNHLEVSPTGEGISELDLSTELLRLIKDSEDRGLGQPVQPVDLTASIGQLSDDELDAEIEKSLKRQGIVR